MNVEFAQRLEHDLPFDVAWLYCVCLFEDGYSDWRMPAYNEYLDYNKIFYDDFCESDHNTQDYCTVTPIRTKAPL